jgi:hypothetical protein
MKIVMADAGLAFDGLTPQERPLGGAESAFVALAEAFAALDHEVAAFTRGARDIRHKGVSWAPLPLALPAADLFIANRDPKLIGARRLGKQVFWLHNPAQFLMKPRYLAPLLRHWPTLVFAGHAHAATAPVWLPFKKALIPLGVEAPFLETPRNSGAPPPRAVFTSNPLRGLAPLLDLWRDQILPAVPEAQLHIFSGPAVYASEGKKADQMAAILRAAADAPGVVMRQPLPKAALAQELTNGRLLAYFGDVGETFCLAVAEAQAMGVPAVVKPVGAVGERVAHGETGFVCADNTAFAAACVRLLTDDRLWTAQSQAALARRADMTWARAAERFLAAAR